MKIIEGQCEENYIKILPAQVILIILYYIILISFASNHTIQYTMSSIVFSSLGSIRVNRLGFENKNSAEILQVIYFLASSSFSFRLFFVLSLVLRKTPKRKIYSIKLYLFHCIWINCLLKIKRVYNRHSSRSISILTG